MGRQQRRPGLVYSRLLVDWNNEAVGGGRRADGQEEFGPAASREGPTLTSSPH